MPKISIKRFLQILNTYKNNQDPAEDLGLTTQEHLMCCSSPGGGNMCRYMATIIGIKTRVLYMRCNSTRGTQS